MNGSKKYSHEFPLNYERDNITGNEKFDVHYTLSLTQKLCKHDEKRSKANNSATTFEKKLECYIQEMENFMWIAPNRRVYYVL